MIHLTTFVVSGTYLSELFLLFFLFFIWLSYYSLNLYQSTTALLTMKLDNLPTDILFSLPNYLDSLDDHYSLIRSSRTLYLSCVPCKAKLSPSFAKRTAQNLFSPHRDLLLASVARQIADWAAQSQDNRSALLRIIRHEEGDNVNYSLLKLGDTVAKLSLEEIQAFCTAKREIVEPLAISLYRNGPERLFAFRLPERGEAWWPVTPFRSWQEAGEALYNYLIYCELFHHSIDGALDPSVEHIGRADRRRWAQNSMLFPDLKNMSKSRQVCNLRALRDHMGFEHRVPNLTPPWKGLTPHEDFACRIIQHQGLATLRCMLDPTTKTAQDFVSDIRRRVFALKEKDFPRGLRYTSQPGATEIALNIDDGWYSIFHDVFR